MDFVFLAILFSLPFCAIAYVCGKHVGFKENERRNLEDARTGLMPFTCFGNDEYFRTTPVKKIIRYE